MALIPTEIVDCCVCGSAEHESVGRGRDFEYDTCSNDWTFVRCSKCGHHYLRERPRKESLPTIYPSNYGNYSNSVRPGLAFRAKSVIERSGMRRLSELVGPAPAIYDLGCGDGRLLDVAKSVWPKATRLAGCEISAVAAENAVGKGYEVDIESFDSLECPGSAFDVIFLIQVIEHLGDPVGAIRKAARMLRPGGLIVIETPSTDCWDYRLFRRRYWGGYHFPRHFNLFNRDTAEQLINGAGLDLLSDRVKLQPVHWVWTAHHFLMEKGAPGFIYRGFHIKNPFFLGLATLLDGCQVFFKGKSSNMQLIARKPLDSPV